MLRLLRIAILALLAFGPAAAAGAQDAAARKPDAAPTAETLQRWIVDLDSRDYAVRQRAAENLVEAQAAAITPLAQAAGGDSLEVTCHAVSILAQLSAVKDRRTEDAAIAALKKLAASAHQSAAWRAANVLVWHKLRTQGRTIAKIRQLGGTVEHNSERINTVRLGSDWKGGDDLALLRELPGFQTLWLEQSPVSDAGLVHLKDMTRLTRLFLGGSKVKGPGLAHLKGLTNLNYLSLKGLKLDEGALGHLAGMSQLTYLFLDDTPITDAALARLKNRLFRF